jgi:hypothetical protein
MRRLAGPAVRREFHQISHTIEGAFTVLISEGLDLRPAAVC